MQAEQPVATAVEGCRAAAVPHLPSGGQDFRQFLEPGPQVSEPFNDVHGGEAFHLAAAFQFVHEVDHRAFPQGPQRLLVARREIDEPGYEGGEGAELIAARPDPVGWVRCASRAESLPKSWHPSQ